MTALEELIKQRSVLDDFATGFKAVVGEKVFKDLKEALSKDNTLPAQRLQAINAFIAKFTLDKGQGLFNAQRVLEKQSTSGLVAGRTKANLIAFRNKLLEAQAELTQQLAKKLPSKAIAKAATKPTQTSTTTTTAQIAAKLPSTKAAETKGEGPLRDDLRKGILSILKHTDFSFGLRVIWGGQHTELYEDKDINKHLLLEKFLADPSTPNAKIFEAIKRFADALHAKEEDVAEFQQVVRSFQQNQSSIGKVPSSFILRNLRDQLLAAQKEMSTPKEESTFMEKEKPGPSGSQKVKKGLLKKPDSREAFFPKDEVKHTEPSSR